MWIAIIEAHYEIQGVADTRKGAINYAKQAYKKFYKRQFPYPDTDIHIAEIKGNGMYVEWEKQE